MNPYQTYQRTSIQTSDRTQVIVLLYEGAQKNLNLAIAQLESGTRETEWSNKLAKTLEIINFLSNALDFERGGEIAQNLANLYDYMRDIITQANIKREVAPLREAHDLLGTLLEGWRGIVGANPEAAAPVTLASPMPLPLAPGPSGYQQNGDESRLSAITA